jgi:hypothetical protein
MHHLGNLYDGGELCTELALVICTIAVLTRRRDYWFAAMGIGSLGVAVVVFGLAQQYLVH